MCRGVKKSDHWFKPGEDECCAIACLASHIARRDGDDYHAVYLELTLMWNPDNSHYVTWSTVKDIIEDNGLLATVYEIVASADQEDALVKKYCSHRLVVKAKYNHYRFGSARERSKVPRFIGILGCAQGDPELRHMVSRCGSRNGSLDYRAQCRRCGNWLVFYKGKGNAKVVNPHFEQCFKCSCGAYAREDGTHKAGCNGTITKWSPRNLKSKPGVISKKELANDEDDGLSGQWFADFEAADFGKGYHEVYLVVVKSISEREPLIFFGRGAMEEFVKFILGTSRKSPCGYLWFHNGSGYDFNLLLPHVCAHMAENRVELTKKGTKVIAATIKTKPNKLHLRDFYLFCSSSLKRLCKDFKVPDEIAKGDFNHRLIKSWEDVEIHKADAVDYCVKDVLCLEYVYVEFTKAMWNICNTHVHTSLTIAGHAMNVWKCMSGQEIVESNHIPDQQLYDALRSCYFGGRVLPTLARYDSGIHLTDEMFGDDGVIPIDSEDWLDSGVYMEEHKDSLVMYDVVSLYPSVMKKCAMPVGQPATVSFTFPGSRERVERMLVMGQSKTVKEEMMRSCYEVDVSCPRDAYVAYLMEKDKDGKNVQSLEDKVKKWYAGPDLFEAVRLGYAVTRIYTKVTWPQSKKVFATYIDKLFELKEKYKHDKTNAMYQCAKYLMNSLSGKFGQKDIGKTCTMLKSFDEAFMVTMMDDLIEFQPLEVDGTVTGMLVDTKKDPGQARRHATQLSVFILAQSRRRMSKMVWSIGGYTDACHVPLYTDTDSLILRRSSAELLPAKYVGGQLGQLENEFPNSYIISARFLAPKTYTLTMLDLTEEGFVLKVKTRCKGIPHRGDVFEPRQYYDKEYEEIDLDNVDLCKRWYFVSNKDGEPGEERCAQYLDCHEYEHVLSGHGKVEVVYGTMDKNFRDDGEPQIMKIRCRYACRNLCVQNWWNTGKRVVQGSNSDMRKPTLCLGQDDPDWMNEFNRQMEEYDVVQIQSPDGGMDIGD